MKSTFFKKAICTILSAILLVLVTSSSMALDSSWNMSNEPSEVLVSSTAGEHGCYRYNLETEESTFISPSEYSDNAITSAISSPDSASGLIDDFPAPHAGGLSLVPGRPTGRMSSTCLIGAKFKKGTKEMVYQGTGWLINDQYLMTAAHLLYLEDYGFATHVAVYVGASGGQGTAKQFRLGQYFDMGGDYYKNPQNYDKDAPKKGDYAGIGVYDDWGIVKLDKPVTATDVQYLGKHVVNNAFDINGTYYTQGYPGYYGLNVPPERTWDNFYMYSESGQLGYLPSRTLPFYWSDFEIYEGQSGSPVYRYISGQGYCVEGMLVASEFSSSQALMILYNDYLNNFITQYC